ncbi:MAG: pseudouridine synthase [Candidatus Methylopumilus sp.]|jgi:23S rRNA pseudouridine2604 synthase
MTTLKLKSGDTTAKDAKNDSAAKATKPPVRRTDPAKRPRTAATKAEMAKATPRTERAPETPRPDTVRPQSVAPDKVDNLRSTEASQRNHRFDGTPRQPYVDKSATPDSRAPAERTLQKGEFKRDEYVRAPRDATGRDTPRRGGKSRDGFEQGAFNRDRASNPMFTAAPRASQPDLPRLSKRMAELGLCSRREADEFISNGWVTVDGVVIDTLGARINPEAAIEISSEARQHQSETVTIIMNKPIGYVSGQAEDGYMPAVTLVHPDNEWHEDGHRDTTLPKFKRGHLQGLAPAGRLDIDSTGLLVFTQDGRVARQLIGENSTIEKEYLVRVEGTLSEAELKMLNFGLSLDGVNLKPAKVSWQNEDQLRFVLREGRKRQIRRMCELVGLHVVGLKRVRIGSVSLGRLPMGSWRYLRLGEKF